MDNATIENYLQQYGWTFKQTEDGAIITEFASDDNHFLVAIQLVAPWLRLSIPAFLRSPDPEVWPEFARQLLNLNRLSRMARFALDESHQVTVCVDLYIENGLDYAQFEIALDALTYVAETAYPHLLAAIEPKGDETNASQ